MTAWNPHIHTALHQLRKAELGACSQFLGGQGSILELGGNDGYQASLLAADGHRVVSLDLPAAPHDSLRGKYHPVGEFDGRRIPFPDASFDMVFSSNTLEHVEDLAGLLAETHRVLRPGGRAVHVLPTVSWRAWAFLGYWPFQWARAGKRLILGRNRRESLPPISWRELFWEKPHGAFPSVAHEFFTYRRAWWKRRFLLGGFQTIETLAAGIFYTPYFWTPWLPIHARKILARFLGSSCVIYHLCRK